MPGSTAMEVFVLKIAKLFPMLIMIVALVGLAHANESATLARGKTNYTLDDWGGAPVRVWCYAPENATMDEPVVMIMHGAGRNAEGYLNQWIPLADAHEFLLVAPEFSDEHFSGTQRYNLGNMTDGVGNPIPREEWSYSAVEHVFDSYRNASGASAETYALYGHSAGSQFSHRFLYLVPEARADLVILANAGWYTLPLFEQDFPYGLGGSRASQEAVHALLARPVIVLLGTEDTDPNHSQLRRTSGAMIQGEHRFARGHFFFETAQAIATEAAVPFNWRLEYVEGAAHSNARMAVRAAELIRDHAGAGVLAGEE